MSLQVYPIASSSSSSVSAKSVTVPNPLTQYNIVNAFEPAIYTITTSTAGSTATIIFYNGTTWKKLLVEDY